MHAATEDEQLVLGEVERRVGSLTVEEIQIGPAETVDQNGSGEQGIAVLLGDGRQLASVASQAFYQEIRRDIGKIRLVWMQV